jgi:hypothetical protein
MKKIILFTPLFISLYVLSQDAVVEDVNPVTESVAVSTKSIEKSGLTQEQIVKLDETTRILLADYQSTTKEFESLKLYNDQVQKIINSQLEEIENIIIKIDELDKTNQRIVPLMLKMIEGIRELYLIRFTFFNDRKINKGSNLKRYNG